SDVAGAYQGLYEELRDVPRGPAKMAVEGACWYDRNIEGLPPVSGDDQYIRFGEPGLHGFIRWVGELFTIKTPELRRQTIVAAMYGTFTKNEAEARKFWAEVARGGEEYAENAPSTILDAWLKAMAEKRGAKTEVKPARLSRASKTTRRRACTQQMNKRANGCYLPAPFAGWFFYWSSLLRLSSIGLRIKLL